MCNGYWRLFPMKFCITFGCVALSGLLERTSCQSYMIEKAVHYDLVGSCSTLLVYFGWQGKTLIDAR